MADALTSTEDLFRLADEALRNADWAAARRLFSETLERGETPEGLEGLAKAAFFLDEAELALDARERAYAGYREAGRVVDAARVAIALAWDYRTVRGERAVGDGWLGRARRLLEGHGPTREQGWLALREASFALPGDAALARERCAEAEALGREFGDVDLEMTAISLDGLARVSQGQIAEGMARLDEATTAATAGEMRDPIAIGFSCCYLIFACERVRDFERAGQWCERVARMAEGWNIRALRAVCRAHYGTVLILRGEWAEAEVVLSEAAAVSAVRPGEGNDVLARLAELRRRQGRAEEAVALLTQASTTRLLCSARRLSRSSVATPRPRPTALPATCGSSVGRRPNAPRGSSCSPRRRRRLVDPPRRWQQRASSTRSGAPQVPSRCAVRRGMPPAARPRPRATARMRAKRSKTRFNCSGARSFRSRRRAHGSHSRRRCATSGAKKPRSASSNWRGSGSPCSARRRKSDGRRRSAGRAAGERSVLSTRESEVLRLIAGGLSNKEIATRLTLSEHTVHRHVANILVDEGAEVVRPLKDLGPAVDQIGPMPYTAFQAALDPLARWGTRFYARGEYLPGLGDAAIDTFLAHAIELTELGAPLSQMVVFRIGQAVATVPDDATAFSHRDANYLFHPISVWTDAADDERMIYANRVFADAMRPFSTGASYLNFTHEADRVRDAYGDEKYSRLVALKDTYDPINLFQLNQNIHPSRTTAEPALA